MENDLSAAKNELLKQYEQRAVQFEESADALLKRYNRWAILRLLIFLLGIGGILLAAAQHWGLAVGAAVVFLLLFYRFVQFHLDIRRREQFDRQLARINALEAAACRHEYQDFPDGQAYQDLQHPYAYDLDLFGPYSLFQYLNRCSTTLGRDYLAAALKRGVDRKSLPQRQVAIQELSLQLAWRQELQAHGSRVEDNRAQLQQLQNWLGESDFVSPNRWLMRARWLLPVYNAVALGLGIAYFDFLSTVLLLSPAMVLVYRTRKQVDTAHAHTARAEKMLSTYATLFQHLEQADFEATFLRKRQEQLGGRAAKAIRQLSYLITQLNVRYNFFAIFLNVLVLWDLQFVYRLERWKQTHGAQLRAWFDCLAELEYLHTQANFHHNHPGFTFPLTSEDGPLRGRGLGHPLIPDEQRIDNDLSMPGRGHIKLITGSNMAGKSTFLRSVGINIILARAGCPVCASSLEMPWLELHSSMRTQDALHERTSSFYAELKRLKVIIDAVEARERVFFLLDEILKGTNSRDRHTGSRALIEQLIAFGGSGLIATHDLELGNLEAPSGGAIENLCMEVAIRGDQLYFDYKLKKGVSQSFNATLLMRRMGIRIDEPQRL